MKNFLSVEDAGDVNDLVAKALEFKHAEGAQHISNAPGKGKTMVLLFFNPSLRTRLSTEKAARLLGMQVIAMNADQGWKLEFEDGAVMNLDKAEHVREAARVISQYADMIGIRTFPGLQDRERDYREFVLQKFVASAMVPVISLESATRHPLQSLTDLMTIVSNKKKDRPKVVLTWAPHPRALPQAVANSFAEWIKKANVNLTITHPRGAELAPEFASNIQVEYDQKKAFEGADFIYAKNWSSYKDYGKMISPSENWMVTAEKMALTNHAKFMHCLPVRRNVVVSDAVIDSPDSLVIEQAGNRVFAAQAILAEILGTNAGPLKY